MLIGNKDIRRYNATQWNVTIGNMALSNESSWPERSPTPIFLDSTLGFKNLKIVLIVKGDGRERTCQNVSDILAELIKPVDLVLDGFSHRFRGYLTKSTHEETVLQRWHKLTLEFSAYEYGREIRKSLKIPDAAPYACQIVNPGNILTPAVLEITPTSGIASLTISGLTRDPETRENQDIILENLEKGKTIVLDGETGLITQDGTLKAEGVEMWELPTLLPGTNTITMGYWALDAMIKFKPRYA